MSESHLKSYDLDLTLFGDLNKLRFLISVTIKLEVQITDM